MKNIHVYGYVTVAGIGHNDDDISKLVGKDVGEHNTGWIYGDPTERQSLTQDECDICVAWGDNEQKVFDGPQGLPECLEFLNQLQSK